MLKTALSCLAVAECPVIGCLHDRANTEQTSSKCIQNARASCSTSARCLLDRVAATLPDAPMFSDEAVAAVIARIRYASDHIPHPNTLFFFIVYHLFVIYLIYFKSTHALQSNMRV